MQFILIPLCALADRWWGGRSELAPWWPFKWSSNPEACIIVGLSGALAFWSPWGLLLGLAFLAYRIDGQTPNRWSRWLGGALWAQCAGDSLQSTWAVLLIGASAFWLGGSPEWALLGLARGAFYLPINLGWRVPRSDLVAEFGSGATFGAMAALAV